MNTITVGTRKKIQVLIDDEDLVWRDAGPWSLAGAGTVQVFWRGQKTLLHRLIVGAISGEIVEFLNGNKTDCRRDNLRVRNTRSGAVIDWQARLTQKPKNNIIEMPAASILPHAVKVMPAPIPPVNLPPHVAPFYDVTGDGSMVVLWSQIASFNISDPEIVLIELAQQVYNPAGRDPQPRTFALEGEVARHARLLVMHLTDPECTKLIKLLIFTQDQAAALTERVNELEAAASDTTLQAEVDRLTAINTALQAKLDAIYGALGKAA